MDICFEIYVANGQNKQTLQIYNFFRNMHSFPTTGAESCEKGTSNMKVYYITTLKYQLTGHPGKFKIKLYYFQERLILRYKS